MKRFVASVAIMLVGMSAAAAQGTCYPSANPDLAGAISLTIGALIGSSIGDGRSQALATGAGALLGASLSPRRPATAPKHALVHQLHEHRNHVMDAAVTGQIPMPRKARPERRRQQTLAHCQETEPGTFACQDGGGAWRILR